MPTSLLFDLADIQTVAIYLCEHYPQSIAERFGYETLSNQLDMRWSEFTSTSTHPLVHPLKPTGNRIPLFLIHPPGGIVACYRELAQHLHPAQPLYAIRSRGLFASDEKLPRTLEEMATDYLLAVESVVGSGPCRLGGWSLGGLIAYEMARQSTAAGREVERLILLDTTIPQGASDLVPSDEQVNVGLEYGIDLTLDQLGELTPEEQLPFLYEHARQLGVLIDEAAPEVVARTLTDLQRLFHHHLALCRNYRLHPMSIDVHLLRPQDVPFQQPVSNDRGWGYLVRKVQVTFVPGHHHSMVQSPNAQNVAKVLSQ